MRYIGKPTVPTPSLQYQSRSPDCVATLLSLSLVVLALSSRPLSLLPVSVLAWQVVVHTTRPGLAQPLAISLDTLATFANPLAPPNPLAPLFCSPSMPVLSAAFVQSPHYAKFGMLTPSIHANTGPGLNMQCIPWCCHLLPQHLKRCQTSLGMSCVAQPAAERLKRP
jgi:hypothetical protein